MCDASEGREQEDENQQARARGGQSESWHICFDEDVSVWRTILSVKLHDVKRICSVVFGIRNAISKHFFVLVPYLFGVGLPSRSEIHLLTHFVINGAPRKMKYDLARLL